MASDSDGQADTNKQKKADRDSQERTSDLRGTSWFLLVVLIAGLLILAIQNAGAKLPSMLWALAWLAAGAMIGFLFGIPRVLQQADVKLPISPSAGSTRPTAAATNEASSYRQQVNTNLEQISDWLTKIIVGIGLVELRRLPDLLNRVSRFMALGLGATQQAQVLAAGIVVYFFIIGFLSGYLLTRIYLSGAFRRADTGSVSIAGITTSISSLFQQLYKSVTDLRELVTSGGIASDAPVIEADSHATESDPPGSGGSTAPKRARVRKTPSILWVDDYPGNNSLQISELKQQGIDVEIAESTDEALSKFRSGTFDVIISDMGRDKEGPKAAINLVSQIRETDQETPFIIYCNRESVYEYGHEATNAGATEVTSSQTHLRNFLKRELAK